MMAFVDGHRMGLVDGVNSNIDSSRFHLLILSARSHSERSLKDRGDRLELL